MICELVSGVLQSKEAEQLDRDRCHEVFIFQAIPGRLGQIEYRNSGKYCQKAIQSSILLLSLFGVITVATVITAHLVLNQGQKMK